MIQYPLDRSKPIHIIKNEPESRRVLIHGYAKDINCTENQNFGGLRGLWVVGYNNLKLSNHDKCLVRLARKKNDIACENEIYARAVAQLEENNIKDA